ncbi:MAG: protein kinase domain-containing protein, partial [Chloroflexia bacterium]
MSRQGRPGSLWMRLSQKLRSLTGGGRSQVQAFGPGGTAPSYMRPGAPCPRCRKIQAAGLAVCPFCGFVLHPSLVWVRQDGSYAYVCPAQMPYVRIGRNPDNHLVVNLDMVSRYHACVWYDPRAGRYYIRDEGSVNGTWVNGRPVYGPMELPLDARVDLAGVAVLYLLTAGRSIPTPGQIGVFWESPALKREDLAYTGQTLGRYRILEVIGESLMSRVYKAVPLDNPSWLVALKQPLAVMDREVMERFRREVELGQRLHHPNIVQIYDYSEDPPFLVMEYVPDSHSLDKLLEKKGRLSLQETVHLAGQVCDALDYAHKNDVVHRDIKPSNVLLAPPGDMVKLCDFGIARARFRPSITVSGTKLGTPLYMAPEQARGERVDHRCDLYSLGVMIYEMLAGR